MKRLLIASMVLVPTLALAQQQPDKTFNITISNSDIKLLDEALGSLPYSRVAPFINSLQVQISNQIRQEQQAKEKPEAKKE